MDQRMGGFLSFLRSSSLSSVFRLSYELIPFLHGVAHARLLCELLLFLDVASGRQLMKPTEELGPPVCDTCAFEA